MKYVSLNLAIRISFSSTFGMLGCEEKELESLLWVISRSVKLEDELDLAATSPLLGDKKMKSTSTAYCKVLFSSFWALVALFY